MKVTVDGTRCSGHGRCYSLAPEVYTADSDGYNDNIGAPIDVPPAEEEAAHLGARMCPERAITIEDE
jgi:ferredoxin